MGLFDKIFGGEEAPKTPQEEQKPEGLSEEKEKEFFDKGDEMGKEKAEEEVEEKKEMTEGEEKEWFKKGDEQSKNAEAPAEKPEQ